MGLLKVFLLSLCVAMTAAHLSSVAEGFWRDLVRLQGWIDSLTARIESKEQRLLNVTFIVKSVESNVIAIKTILGLDDRPTVVITDPTLAGKYRLRLVGGSRTRGRLEVFRNWEWGTVCDDDFSDASAAVVCNYLNLPWENAEAIPRFGGGDRKPILWDNVVCRGTDVKYCSHNGWAVHDCSHDEDVGIHCE